eukprot:scaffold33385_cov131-Skeletonema_marinoi.AAC.2
MERAAVQCTAVYGCMNREAGSRSAIACWRWFDGFDGGFCLEKKRSEICEKRAGKAGPRGILPPTNEVGMFI